MSEKLEDFTVFSYNPFLKNLRESNAIQSKDHKAMVPTSLSIRDKNNKFVSPAFVKQNIRKFSDVREFGRIPIDGIKLLASLEKPELKVFCYILTKIKYSCLEIELQADKIRQFYDYTSRNPIYKGIIGLLKKWLIAKMNITKSIYYINPIYFYKGQVVGLFFEYLSESNLRIINTDNNDLEEQSDFYDQKAVM